MCAVCGAIMLCNNEILTLKSKFTKDEYSIKASENQKPEIGPSRYSLKKNKEPWSAWIQTKENLAGVVGGFGFDIKNRFRNEIMDERLGEALHA